MSATRVAASMEGSAMTEMLEQQVSDASAWVGADLQNRDDLIYRLSDREIAELDAALRSVQERGLDVYKVTRDDFVLPEFGKTLAGMLGELNHGRGFLLIHGFPRQRYSEEDCGIVHWGIGTHFGKAVSQNARGDLLGHVRDTGMDIMDPHVRGYQTRIGLPYHSDGSDVVGLFCLQDASSGGESTVLSSVTVHNRFLERRPDLLEVLYQPFALDRREEVAEGQKPYYNVPVYTYYDGLLSCRYIRGYVQSAQRFPEVPRLTSKQNEAFALMDEIIAGHDMPIRIRLQPGDMEYANNYTVLHARSAFEDWPEPQRKRHLLRLWLTVYGGRKLPSDIGGPPAVDGFGRGGITPSQRYA